MRNFFVKYRTVIYVSILMLVPLITGHQFLLAQVPNDADSRFPIFSSTAESHAQPKTNQERLAELEDRVAAGRQAARFQAEKRAKEELKTEYEIRERGRQAEQDAEQRIRKDIARERHALLLEQQVAQHALVPAHGKNVSNAQEPTNGTVSIVGSAASSTPESQVGVQAKPVKLTPDLEPIELPSPDAADKTEKVTDEAEYTDVLQQQYRDQREQKIAELLVKIPDKLDLAHESAASTQVAGSYARIRIGAYDFVFKMIDGAWTIEFFDALYRYDAEGKIKK
jgi:hypothetical protein